MNKQYYIIIIAEHFDDDEFVDKYKNASSSFEISCEAINQNETYILGKINDSEEKV